MPDNPYSPPAAQDRETAEFASESLQRQRPLGITLLSILSLLGGVAMFLLLLQQIATFDRVSSAGTMEILGVPAWLLLINFLLLAVTATGAAVGMWNGTPWGWWLGGFYFMYAVFRNVSAVVNVVNLADQLEATERGAAYYLIKYGLRVLINALVFMYLFKGNVLLYFNLEDIVVPKAVGMIVAVCVSITLAFMAVGFVTQ